MDKVLEAIKDFANRCHGTQTRKYSNDPYIVHPVRVMEICKAYTQDITVLAAALLHDVLEDTAVARHELSAFLSQHMGAPQVRDTMRLVDELTDEFVKARYPQWNRKKRKAAELDRLVKTSAWAQTIKYADMIDNCRGMARDDREFAGTFLRECRKLLQHMDQGNAELRKKAMDTVEAELAVLKS